MPASKKVKSKIQTEIAELSGSIGGLIDSFRKLRSPLLESHEKVPQATDQLDKISEQTEAAAQKMLDMVESITQRDDEVIVALREIQRIATEANLSAIKDLANNTVTTVETNQNDAFTIMDALQFQDITSQQMDHAASLLEDIEVKLDSILGIVGEKSRLGDGGPRVKRERAFDPHADLFEKTTNQNDIDSLFANGSDKQG